MCVELYVSLYVYHETKLKHTPRTNETTAQDPGHTAVLL